MKINIRHLLLVLTVAILALGGVLIENARAGQPHMSAALDNLRAARHQLEIATHNKGGHRDAAIAIIDNAIAEVKAGIDAGE